MRVEYLDPEENRLKHTLSGAYVFNGGRPVALVAKEDGLNGRDAPIVCQAVLSHDFTFTVFHGTGTNAVTYVNGQQQAAAGDDD